MYNHMPAIKVFDKKVVMTLVELMEHVGCWYMLVFMYIFANISQINQTLLIQYSNDLANINRLQYMHIL